MKQVLIRSGQIVVDDVPAPIVGAGGALVRVRSSCISAGTESAGITGGYAALATRALQEPGRIKNLLRLARERGVRGAVDAVRGAVAEDTPVGYSVAGVVAEVGAGVTDLGVGDEVACAGAGSAQHAECVVVPRNLIVKIPEGVSHADASTVALGAIALHGVRRLEPTLGEWVVVVGLGLIGQLAVQLLRAHGCRVIGSDLSVDRIELARSLGMEAAIAPGDEDPAATVRRLTDGYGADGVMITAASRSDDVVRDAFRLCRRKGRVVVVGDVGLGLRREDLYAHELELRISTSYGPGRYDPRYEQEGLDYPIGYVRWTEGRNMREYLQLLAEGKVRLAPLIGGTYSVTQAPQAYASLASRGAAPIVLLTYPGKPERTGPQRGGFTARGTAPRPGRIGVAVVGAGTFAREMHLPNLRRLGRDFDLRLIVGRSGVHAQQAAKQFGAAAAATDYREALTRPDVHAVLICTRHHLHARMALEALRAGKHVFVEKPLALEEVELRELEAFFGTDAGEQPLLLTGFNRRFSRHARRLRAHLAGRTNPVMLHCRVNAGYIPPDHWVHGAEGGGRNIGEACHLYDLFLYLVDAPVLEVQAASVRPRTGYYVPGDNFTATLRFQDGSIATLVYSALGSRRFPKERLEAFADGTVAVLDDYRELTLTGARPRRFRSRRQDKGHAAELEAFARAIQGGGEPPIPLWQQFEATRVSFEVERALRTSGLGRGAHRGEA